MLTLFHELTTATKGSSSKTAEWERTGEVTFSLGRWYSEGAGRKGVSVQPGGQVPMRLGCQMGIPGLSK